MLLARLLLADGDVLRKRIAFALWPDENEETALANTRRHLGLLEATLPRTSHPWILKNRVNISWAGGARAYVDITTFRKLGDDPERFAEAAELYNGPFMETSDDDWVVEQRQQFLERQVAMLRALVVSKRRTNDPTSALAFAERALRLDPFCENILREVMLLRHETGDRIGALDAYRSFRDLSERELGAKPLEETNATYEAIATEELAPSIIETMRNARPLRRDNLPASLTSFHGRHVELESLKTLVVENRLLTLWGPGGVGKTRLAVEAGAALKSAFDGRVRFVDLALLENDSHLVETVLAATGLHQIPGQTALESVIAVLADRNTLLILDNCEHLLEACATLADRILCACPDIHIVATSREPLGMQGERVFSVDPFDIPLETAPTFENSASLPVVSLFLDRARRTAREPDADFGLSDIVAICRKLDGLPLAIELAASQAHRMTLKALLASLDRRFDRLTVGNRGALPRHRTLEAAISWSVDRLSMPERELFARLAVFRGQFEGRTAIWVCTGERERDDVANVTLRALVARSLLTEVSTGDGTRYAMLESIRAFAAERCSADAVHAVIIERHAIAYEDIARDAGKAFWSQQNSPWVRRIEAEIADVRAALHWFFGENGDPARGGQMLATLRPFWLDSGRILEVLDWYRLALEHGEDVLGHTLYLQLLHDSAIAALRSRQLQFVRTTIAKALERCGPDDDILRGGLIQTRAVLANTDGDRVESRRLLRDAVRILAASGSTRELAFALSVLGGLLVEAADADFDGATAEKIFLNALEIARQEGLVIIEARALHGLASIAERTSDAARAYRLSKESLAVFRSGDGRGRMFMGYALLQFAHLSLLRSETVAAREAIREAFSFFWFSGLTDDLADALECCAELKLSESRPEAVAVLLGATHKWQASRKRNPRAKMLRLRIETTAKAQLSSVDFAAAFARGEGLSFDEAIAEAMTPAVPGDLHAR